LGIKGFFQPRLEPERERSLQDPEQILAWFEELDRTEAGLELHGDAADLVPVAARVVRVDEEGASFTLALKRTPNLAPVAGQRFGLTFPMDGLRFRVEASYLGRGRYLEYRFALPAAIRFAERRDAFRVRFRPREHHQAIVIEDILQGVALSGRLLDLAMGGCGLVVHRAMLVQTGMRLGLDADLLQAGAPVAIVRLPNLPRLPLLEFSGRVSHLRQTAHGVVLGVAFSGVGGREAGFLARIMADRLPGFRVDFPRKRRTRDLLEVLRESLEPQDSPAPAPEEEPAEPGPEDDLEVPAEPGEESGPGPDRVRLLRKRGKKILLVHADELQRTILAGAFRADGYRCLYEASSLVQALDIRRRMPLDLLLVDQSVGVHGALELVEVLRTRGLPRETPVVVLQRRPEVRLTLAAKGGGVTFLVDHPVDFQGRLKDRLEALLGLDSGPRGEPPLG